MKTKPAIRIDLASPVPACRQIANALRTLLVAGTFPVGEPLLTVRQLAVALGAELERRRRLAVATGPFRGGGARFERDQPTLLPEAQKPLEAILAELNRDGGLKLLVNCEPPW